jgi:hypothetical protein
MIQGRLKFRRKGFEEILCCEGTQQVLEQLADNYIEAAYGMAPPDGDATYERNTKKVKQFRSLRLRTTIKAMNAKDEAENKSLLRAVGVSHGKIIGKPRKRH